MCLSFTIILSFSQISLILSLLFAINGLRLLTEKDELLVYAVKENSPRDTIIGQINIPGFLPPFEVHHFQSINIIVSKDSGIIRVGEPIDRERKSSYSIVISSSDVVKNIQVNILDENDNAPKFNMTSLEIVIPENHSIRSKIDLTSVYDADEGQNSIRSIVIRSGDSEGHFGVDYLNSSHGHYNLRLVLLRQLDYESTTSFALVIEASDGGSPPLSASLHLTIVIADANDNAPKFDLSRYAASVKEDKPLGSTILSVRATDKDAGQSSQLIYSIDNGPDARLFSIHPQSGDVTLAASLDYETKRQLTGTIAARDNALPYHTSSVSFIVDVIDVNDNPPLVHIRWPQQHTAIDINSAPNSIIAHVTVTDPDSVSTLFFLQIINESPLKLSKIDPRMWEMKTTDRLKFIKTDNISLTLEVTDHPPPSLKGSTTITIQIKRSKSASLTFASRKIFVELENPVSRSAENITIVALSTPRTTDNADLHFSLTNNKKGLFFIDKLSGQVTSVGSIDCGFYTVGVSLVKGSLVMDTAEINVSIRGTPKSNIYFIDGFRKILFQKTAGTLDCPSRVTVANTHCNKRVKYKMESLLKASGPFHITEFGDVCLDGGDNRERMMHERHMYKVTASEKGSTDVSTDILMIPVPPARQLHVLTNDVVVTLGSLNFSAPVGRVIATFPSYPPYLYYGVIQYKLKQLSNVPSPVNVDQITGEIMVSEGLMAGESDRYVEVLASCVNQDIAPQTIVVTLSSGGSLRFTRSLYEFHVVLEARSLSERRVGQVLLDGDSSAHGAVSFYLKESSFGESLFSIDTASGVIRSKNLPSQQHVVSLNVFATRLGRERCYAQVLVTIDGVDTPPSFYFTSIDVNVWENATVGTEIVQMIPSSPSWSDHYSISYGRFSNCVRVHPKSGHIFLAEKFDREKTPRAVVTVELRNRWGSVKADVSISILDNNDSPPTCDHTTVNVTLNDNTPLLHVICPIKCSDADTLDNANLTYDIQMTFPNWMLSPLRMHMLTGCLEVASTLDLWARNPLGTYRYTVRVSDNARDGALKTSVKIHVRILDTNNHRPFLRSYPIFQVQEGASFGTKVGVLSIGDEDPSGEVIVSIDDGSYSRYFYTETINKNGAVFRTRNLNGLRPGIHNVSLKLTDPPHISRVNVSIFVRDSNNHAPKISFPLENQTILFSCPLLPGSRILVMECQDADFGLNSRLNFLLGSEEDVFAIVKNSGVLTTKISPSCSRTRRLEIFVVDLGNPRRSSSVNIVLSPENKEAQFITIEARNLSFVIPEKARSGTILGNMNIHPWTMSLGMTYLFGGVSTISPDNVLHIDYDNHNLVLLLEDVAPKSTTYHVIVICHKVIAPPRSFDLYLTLISNKLETGWPTFSNHLRTISVKENQPPGTIVSSFSTRYSEITAPIFSLRQPDEYFVIDSVTGVLVTFVPLDREKMIHDQFSIEIIATDFHDANKTAVLPIEVLIEDVNDNAPLIIGPVNSTIEVVVSGSMNGSIARVVAVDHDKGRNGQFKYHSDRQDLFTIDPQTGSVWLLLKPKIQNYDLNVSVTDHGEPPLTSWMILSFYFLKSEAEKKIRFSTGLISMNLSLASNGPPSILGRVMLASSTSNFNPHVKFHLMAGRFSHLLQIDPVTGDIKPSRQIFLSDIGSAEILKMSVVASVLDDPNNHDTAKLQIFIDHGNNNAPYFSKSKFTVKLPEGEAITDFLTVAAHDPDLGVFGMVTYQLLGDVEDRRISIDAKTGRLSCSSLHYLDRKIYNLEVLAMDSLGGPLSKNQTAYVQVIVQNSKQQQIEFNSTHFTLTLMENLPNGTVLGSITVQRKAPLSKIVYLLNRGHPLIHLNSSNGLLKTNGPVDRESIPFIEITMQAVSSQPNSRTFQSAQVTVNIRVLDENDNAPIPSQNPVFVHISNPSEGTTALATLSATDPDLSSNITFQFDLNDTTTRSLSSRYYLDPSSGILRSRSNSPMTEPTLHILTVLVSDNGAPPRTTRVLLHIEVHQRRSLLTVTPEKAIFRLLENQSIGTFIGQIRVPSNCSSSRVSFAVIDGIHRELVYLHAMSGKLFVSSSGNIDRERVKQIVLWTQALCEGTDLVGYKKVVINVDDVDDNRPVFSQEEYVSFLLEGQPPKTIVVRTSIYDPDDGVNSKVEYFIELYSPLDEFSIDSEGVVKTNIPLNFHTKPLYNLIIKATSKSTPLLFAECRVTVYIININDQRPVFSSPLQYIEIYEDAMVGSLLTTVVATDSDGADGLSYRIQPRTISNRTRFLSVAYDSGEVFLSRRILPSDRGRHEIDIVADDGKYSSSTIMRVDVLDINNEYPVLLEDGHYFIISETLPRQSIILYLHASDGDSGVNGQVKFEISPSVSWLTLKDFQNNTAALYLLSHPNNSNKVNFVGIQLSDRSTDPKSRLSSMSTIVLLTESSNPHPPHFLNGTKAYVSISQLQSVGSQITSLRCVDPEDQVLYSVNSSISNLPLYIDSVSGDLFMIGSLASYSQPSLELVIMCRDSGKPPRQASLLLFVQGEQKNERLPFWNYDVDDVRLQVASNSEFPLFVMNLDKRVWTNPLFTLLSVVPNNGIDYVPVFQVDEYANLRLLRAVGSGSWSVILRVVHKGTDLVQGDRLFYCSYMRMTIIVNVTTSSTPDNCVNIEKLTSVIKENESPATTVINLPLLYSDIIYTLAEDIHFVLTCNENSPLNCKVKSRIVLDFEKIDRYNLNLVVSGRTPKKRSCSHSIILQINVLDVDEYPPIFAQSEYSYSVPGGVPEPGSVLFTVQATDRDKGVFGLVFYQLEGNDNPHFDIHNKTGQIYLKTAFPVAKDVGSRKRRDTANTTKKSQQRETFVINVVANSGQMVSTTKVLLNIWIPYNTKNRPHHPNGPIPWSLFQICLIIGVPTIVVLITIFLAVFLILWKRKCLRCQNDAAGTTYDDSEGTRSNRTDSLKTCSDRHYKQPPLPTRNNTLGQDEQFYNQLVLPDVTLFHQHSTLINSLHNSETQEFNLNGDDNFQHIDRNTSTLSHSSGTSSMRVDEVIPMGYCSPSVTNDPSSSQFCDSGLGNNNKNCHCYNDKNNDRYHYRTRGLNIKSHDSDLSGTSSSCYSAISQKHLHNPYSQVALYNHSNGKQRSNEALREGPVDHTRGPRKRYLPSSSRGSRLSGLVKNDPGDGESMPFRSVAPVLQHSYVDIRNNNHQSAIPLMARVDGRSHANSMQFVGYSDFRSSGAMCQIVSVDVPQASAISHSGYSPNRHDPYAQKSSDITDIDC